MWDIKIHGIFCLVIGNEVRKKGRVVSAVTDNISTLDQAIGNCGYTVDIAIGVGRLDPWDLRRSLLCILQSERMTRMEGQIALLDL